uniref:Uncharacterized protein n=1 Tax=Rhizophora mucronata TaxID=61149 RepID=A0A2P2JUP8_RHIMU
MSIAYVSPTFTTKKISLQTMMAPKDRKTIYFINLCESTKVNRIEGDATFLYGFLIFRTYGRGDLIRRFEFQRVSTGPTTVRDVRLGHILGLMHLIRVPFFWDPI